MSSNSSGIRLCARGIIGGLRWATARRSIHWFFRVPSGAPLVTNPGGSKVLRGFVVQRVLLYATERKRAVGFTFQRFPVNQPGLPDACFHKASGPNSETSSASHYEKMVIRNSVAGRRHSCVLPYNTSHAMVAMTKSPGLHRMCFLCPATLQLQLFLVGLLASFW